MGHPNQLYFASAYCQGAKKVLEVGSYAHENSTPLRDLWPDYTGLDIAAGPNVDIVHDLTEGLGPLKPEYDLVVCCSVLEHVKNPWKMAETMQALLVDGGRLYLATPWVWRYHKYPDDYWRFSFTGIQLLFPAMKWEKQVYSTNVAMQFINAEDGADQKQHGMLGKVKYLPYLELHSLGVK